MSAAGTPSSEWVAIIGLGATLAGGIICGLTYAGVMIWRASRTHEQHIQLIRRVDKLEAEAEHGEEHRSAVRLLEQAFLHIQEDLKEVKETLKGILKRRADGE